MTFRESRLCKVLTASTIILGAAFIAALTLLLVPRASYHEVIPPQFNRTREISYQELANITRGSWPQDDRDSVPMHIRDECFLLYSMSDFDRFREYWRKNNHKGFSVEFNDCDDYATIAQGREREWFTSHLSDSKCGSSFGSISGELNFFDSEEECRDLRRGHSMNFFVDNSLQVWGYEPQVDRLYLVPLQWCPSTYLLNVFV
ncbi:hypothetical protein BNJ_00421 [Kaumoebavirus]|uniref:hypothetical protein n=1 Tax=Kaumoebavirus TaxID=1859492 RepID=UPI0009C23B95|nr:hypothetical protein BNJ_00421 [Kaumoebavirus]ARA72236.1 hypothetical protein BNJ_00421 [Kaumoebavirus]